MGGCKCKFCLQVDSRGQYVKFVSDGVYVVSAYVSIGMLCFPSQLSKLKQMVCLVGST